jgi:uncharacterized protein YcfL
MSPKKSLIASILFALLLLVACSYWKIVDLTLRPSDLLIGSFTIISGQLVEHNGSSSINLVINDSNERPLHSIKMRVAFYDEQGKQLHFSSDGYNWSESSQFFADGTLYYSDFVELTHGFRTYNSKQQLERAIEVMLPSNEMQKWRAFRKEEVIYMEVVELELVYAEPDIHPGIIAHQHQTGSDAQLAIDQIALYLDEQKQYQLAIKSTNLSPAKLSAFGVLLEAYSQEGQPLLLSTGTHRLLLYSHRLYHIDGNHFSLHPLLPEDARLLRQHQDTLLLQVVQVQANYDFFTR